MRDQFVDATRKEEWPVRPTVKSERAKGIYSMRHGILFGLIGAFLPFLVCADSKDVQMTITVNVNGSGATDSVSTIPVANVPEKQEDSLSNLEPVIEDAADPRRLVRYFCRLWKDEDYQRMYWTMTERYRKAVTLKKFSELFKSDAERTGGLRDENIIVSDVDEGKNYIVTVDLQFNFVRAKERRVKAVLEKGRRGYRIKESGIIPLDLNNL